MDSWTICSRPAVQRAVGLVVALVGAALTVLGGRGPDRSWSATWLGVLLVVAGVASVLAAVHECITIDPGDRTITIDTRRAGAAATRIVHFAQIDDIRLNRLGSASNGTVFYSLSLMLLSGETLTLFAPGRFVPGSMDRATVDGWRSRLWNDVVRDRGLTAVT